MGTGAVPDVMLARAAGPGAGRDAAAIACSSSLATSAAGVWAAGDACEYESVLHGRRMRIEHWEVARAQGKAAAAAVAGRPADFAEVPYFWSDLADWATLEYVGPGERVGPRGRARLDRGRRVRGLLPRRRAARRPPLSVGRPEDLMQARRLLAEGPELGERAPLLGDLGADLSEL